MYAYSEYSDQQLVQAFCQFDKEAGNEIFRRHYPAVLKASQRYLRNIKDAEDITQNVFLKVLAKKKINNYRGEAALKTWLIRIAINNCKALLIRRQGRRQVEYAIWKDYQMQSNRAHPAPGAEDAVIQSEKQQWFKLAVFRLPAKYQPIVLMFYTQQKSCKEISRQLKLPVNTLCVYLHRARKLIGKYGRANAGAASLAA